MSRRRTLPALLVGLSGVILAGCVATGSGQGATTVPQPTPSPTLVNCGVGVPLVKCNPSLYSPPAGLTPPPTPPGSPPQEAAQTVTCGTGFFDTTMWATLGTDFGSISCFRFAGGSQWVVIGDGLSLTSSRPAPSTMGAMIAVEDCAANDSSCRGPNAIHDFAAFLVTYPPGSMSGRTMLVGLAAGRFLDIANSCTALTFDLKSLSWYRTDAGDLGALQSGASVTPAFRPPQMVSGSTALKTPAPASLQTCSLP